MTDLGNEQSSLREQRTMDNAAPRAPECMITFAVTGGIFGVGRLAARLDELSESGRIGAWHIGPWVDWRHTAIRVNFDTPADAALARHRCSDAGQRPRSALSGPKAGSHAP